MADRKDYNDLWQKIASYVRIAGREVVEKALWLFYTAESSATPKWAKGVIFAALAYFIAPIDAIPDLTPGIGFTDDLGVLISGIAAIGMHITPKVKEQAKKKMVEWFDNS